MAASERLAYRPNELVRGIFGPRSFTVGLVSTDSFGRFSGPVMAGAEDALGSGEVSVIMCDSRGDAEREQRHLATLLGRRIDGLIVTGGARTRDRRSRRPSPSRWCTRTRHPRIRATAR